MSDGVVWIAEAYKDNQRIERVVHSNEADAWEDIEVLTHGENPDDIVVEAEKVWLGQDRSLVIER